MAQFDPPSLAAEPHSSVIGIVPRLAAITAIVRTPAPGTRRTSSAPIGATAGGGSHTPVWPGAFARSRFRAFALGRYICSVHSVDLPYEFPYYCPAAKSSGVVRIYLARLVPAEHTFASSCFPKNRNTATSREVSAYQPIPANCLSTNARHKHFAGPVGAVYSAQELPVVLNMTSYMCDIRPTSPSRFSRVAARSLGASCARPTCAIEMMEDSKTSHFRPRSIRLVEKLPGGPEWSYEVKWDGCRPLALNTVTPCVCSRSRRKIWHRNFGPSLRRSAPALTDGDLGRLRSVGRWLLY